MGYQRADVQTARKYESGDLVLQRVIRGIAANQVIFVQADTRKINLAPDSLHGMGEKEDLRGTTHQLHRLKHGGVGGDGYNSGDQNAVAAQQ